MAELEQQKNLVDTKLQSMLDNINGAIKNLKRVFIGASEKAIKIIDNYNTTVQIYYGETPNNSINYIQDMNLKDGYVEEKYDFWD